MNHRPSKLSEESNNGSHGNVGFNMSPVHTLGEVIITAAYLSWKTLNLHIDFAASCDMIISAGLLLRRTSTSTSIPVVLSARQIWSLFSRPSTAVIYQSKNPLIKIPRSSSQV